MNFITDCCIVQIWMRINKECNKQHNSSLQKKKIQTEFWLRWAKIIIDRHWELVPVVSWMFVCLSRLSGTVCIDQTNKGGKQHCETPRSPPRLFGCYALDFTLFQHTMNSSQSSCTDRLLVQAHTPPLWAALVRLKNTQNAVWLHAFDKREKETSQQKDRNTAKCLYVH